MQEETKNSKSDAALREEKVLEFWRANKTFEKTLAQTQGKKEFIFYEGPPTANGIPGIHHLEARAFKDAIPRYKTMRGFHVRRKGGWDTHGLPVEIQAEKKLGLKSKKEIEEYGIARFNQECKESVWEYLDVWNKFTKRIGYWVDQENPYITYHNDYIESVWNIVKKINEEKLLYKDYKVVPWCPRCETALSSHELAQGYEDVKDLSVYVKFKVKNQENTFILAWTTTPWTLLGNVALAVGKDIDYVKIKTDSGTYILAKERLSLITDPYEIVEEFKGGGLFGLEYEPLYPYLTSVLPVGEKPKLDKAFKVHGASFVTTADGTGVVHTAVMYGQDDFELGTKVGLPKHHLVGTDGKFLPGTGEWAGRFVRDESVSVDIIKDLAKRGLLFKKEKYEHSYPHCWRCHTALIYYARDSWYIKMSDPHIKKKLIEENKKINWEPEHIREGRFGEWLREIKDWAISRERYWGTPLPVWADKNNNFRVIGSVEELKKMVKKSDNKYFVMRHGGSVANLTNADSLKPGDAGDMLTDKGKEQTKSKILKVKLKPDIIVSSNFNRTRATAEIAAEVFGLTKENIIINEALGEFGSEKFSKESTSDVRKRIIGALQSLEEKYSNKNILIITHEYPIRVLFSSFEALSEEEEATNLQTKYPSINNAEILACDFLPLPRNESGQIDLHRPYIDNLALVDKDGLPLVRTKEVMDVWFDSGAMPFAQDHYPFENKKWVDGAGYPADFISEAIDQTRGWFYTLHAVGILMERGRAFKNAICLGHLLDASGKKMSKSLGNVVDPWEAMDKYGVDTLRLWMYSVNQPGESKNFDEKTVALLSQQVFGLLYNVLAFYELYRDEKLEKNDRPKSKNVLDQWILSKLDELIKLSEENLDGYKLLEPVRAAKEFIGDLSTWYLRRSRERIKIGDKDAKQTLYFVLKNLAKVLAPFTPFAAEDIYLKLKLEKDPESVHLEKWPKAEKVDKKIIEDMGKVREITTFGLARRQILGLKVKQPLSEIFYFLHNSKKLTSEFEQLIKEELNIKNVIWKEDTPTGRDIEYFGSGEIRVAINEELTEELEQEGNYRELARALQELRKKAGLTPKDLVTLSIETDEVGRKLIEKFEKDLKKTVLVSKIDFQQTEGEVIKIDTLLFKVRVG